jgi:hypothetical protein
MRSQSIQGERRAAAPEFDLLAPPSILKVRPTRPDELGPLARLARSAIPGADVDDAYLEVLRARDPSSVFSFLRGGELVGGCAFLYLNYRGHDALVLDCLDVHQPDADHLAAPEEHPEAIYLWAIAGAGRSALGPISALFAGARYRMADLYTRPVTDKGAQLFTSLGFEPACSWSPGLWVYRRLASRTAFDKAA